MRGCVEQFQGILPITMFPIMPTLQTVFFSTDAHSTDSVITYPSAKPTHCSLAILGSFNSHSLRKMLSPLPIFYSYDGLSSFCVTDTLSSTASLNIHLD